MTRRYGPVGKFLHWAIAMHMIGLIALGWWMVELTYYSPWYTLAPWLHKAFGVVVFVLGIALVAWRARAPEKRHVGHSAFERVASASAQGVMIVCILAIPMSGYLFTTASGDGIDLFGIATLPALVPVSETLREAAIDVHVFASYGLLCVIAAHAAGALKHHFVDRDRTLRDITVG